MLGGWWWRWWWLQLPVVVFVAAAVGVVCVTRHECLGYWVQVDRWDGWGLGKFPTVALVCRVGWSGSLQHLTVQAHIAHMNRQLTAPHASVNMCGGRFKCFLKVFGGGGIGKAMGGCSTLAGCCGSVAYVPFHAAGSRLGITMGFEAVWVREGERGGARPYDS